MTQRRFPRISEIRELIRFRPFILNSTKRRLSKAHTILDLRKIAKSTTPKSVFNYTDGAADAEINLRKVRSYYRQIEFVPTLLRGVGNPDPSSVLFGEKLAFPLVLAPTGYTRMMHNDGEAAVSRVASKNGIAYALSTVGTSTVEEVFEAAPEGNNWFQLYLSKERKNSEDLIARAQAAGVKTLIVTVDTAVGGARVRELRDGLTIPPTMSFSTFFDMALHPSWWFDKLTTKPIEFASLKNFGGNSSEVADKIFEPDLNFDDIAWLRKRWPHNLVVKGIQTVSDAMQVYRLGADGVVLSTHGGRQLDRSRIVLKVVPELRKAAGPDKVILVDSGILSGADVLAAVALGADAAMVGRAYLYGIMAGGELGVQRAVDILRGQYLRSMQLLGVRSTAQLTPEHVFLP